MVAYQLYAVGSPPEPVRCPADSARRGFEGRSGLTATRRPSRTSRADWTVLEVTCSRQNRLPIGLVTRGHHARSRSWTCASPELRLSAATIAQAGDAGGRERHRRPPSRGSVTDYRIRHEPAGVSQRRSPNRRQPSCTRTARARSSSPRFRGARPRAHRRAGRSCGSATAAEGGRRVRSRRLRLGARVIFLSHALVRSRLPISTCSRRRRARVRPCSASR